MTKRKMVAAALTASLVLAGLAGCPKPGSVRDELIDIKKLGEFSDKRGQARVKLLTYSGPAKLENIKKYVGTMGCGMLYAYFYSADTDPALIPVEELQSAGTFSQARDVLFQGEGYAKWDFGAACLGIIPTVTDCRKTPYSSNCR